MRLLITLTVLIVFVSCDSIKFKKQVLYDVYEQPAASIKTKQEIFTEGQGLMWNSLFNCGNFEITQEDAYTGKSSIKLSWNKASCEWIGFGNSFNNWQPVDLSKDRFKKALSFYVRTQSKTAKAIPIVANLEDYSGGGSYYFIDANKYSIESRIWKNSNDFSDGLAVVKIGEKYGYINNKGQIVIPIIYDYAEAFINGVAFVSMNENGVSNSKIITTKGVTLVNDFTIHSYSIDNKYVFGSKQIDEETQAYFKLNIKNGELERIAKSFNSLSYYINYTKGVYKDVEVYLNQKNIPLMSSEINFSTFESMKLVENASPLIYDDNTVDKAITLLDKAISADPNNINAYLQMANAYKQKDYYSQAISFYNKAIDIDEDNLNALREKAAYSYEKKYYSDAVDSYNKIANKSSDDFSFYFNKAYAENSIGQIDNAIESYTIYINNYPNSSMAFNNRGACYYRKGYYQKAVEDYTSAIRNGKNETKENLGMFYNNRGSGYYYLNKRVEACLDYKRAADLGNSSAINSYRNCK